MFIYLMNETYLESQHRFLFLCFFMPHLFVCFLNIYIVDLQCCVSFRYIYSKVIQLHTHTHILFQILRFCSLICYYKILNIVPYAIL